VTMPQHARADKQCPENCLNGNGAEITGASM